ncbi:MAG: GNAT family N-acetyltransferase [Pseudomonadota bacterium]
MAATSDTESGIEAVRLSAEALSEEVAGFAALLHACVHGGASVGFILPFELDAAEAFWRDRALSRVNAGQNTLWAARYQERLAGTVQLNHDMMPNQPHRAEVTKLLVEPSLRHRGIGRALMTALEDHARESGRTLLTLETLAGSGAESFYLSLGYSVVGVIPGYCRVGNIETPGDATFMYKAL